jgi:hypothetical protein
MLYYELIKRKINAFLFLFLCLQVMAWTYTEKHTPNLGILDAVPSLNEAKIAALGDEQFYFRFLALNLQNSGDSFGRFTALRSYDFKLLQKWLNLLDELDSKSNFVPSIASYYYSNTQKVEDNIYIVEYLEKHYDRDPKNKWWWLGMACNIANFKLKDKNLALRLAFKLSTTKGAHMPRWAQQMPAIIYAEMGEKQMALEIIKDIAERFDDFSQGEINFMNNFIKERLGYIRDNVGVQAKDKDVEPLYLDPRSAKRNSYYNLKKSADKADKGE